MSRTGLLCVVGAVVLARALVQLRADVAIRKPDAVRASEFGSDTARLGFARWLADRGRLSDGAPTAETLPRSPWYEMDRRSPTGAPC